MSICQIFIGELINQLKKFKKMQNQGHSILILDFTIQTEGVDDFYQTQFQNLLDSTKMCFNTLSFLSPKTKEPHHTIISIEDSFFNVNTSQK